MTTEIKAMLILGVLLAAFGAGWAGNGWRLDAKYQKEKRVQLEVNQKAYAKLIADRDALSDKLTAANDTSTKKLQKAQRETKRLRNLADAGSVGLRIDARCPTTGITAKTSSNPGVDTRTWAELAGPARKAYFDLRDGINYASGQLAACQSELRLRQ